MPACPVVTVVVPTHDSARTLERCLDSVRRQRHGAVELVVVDNQSTDATVSIAQRHAHIVAAHGPERSAQRNEGARLGRGDVLAFVDSDMVLSAGVLAEAVDRFGADEELGALVVDEVAFGSGWLVRCRRLEKELCVGDASVEAARIFRRAAFDAAGGFDEHLYACEDWDLADRVLRLGWRTERIRAAIHHDEGRISLRAAFAKKRYYGWGAAGWLGGPAAKHRRARPLTLAVAVARSGAPRTVRAGLAILKCVEWSGFALGLMEARASSGTRRRGSGRRPRVSR